MDKSFSRFKKNIKQPSSLIQSQINIRCVTEQSQHKTVISKNTVPTVPQLLCENDQLRQQNQNLKIQIKQLEQQLLQAKMQKREDHSLYKGNQNMMNYIRERKSCGYDDKYAQNSVKDRIRIFQNAMKDLTFQRNSFPYDSPQSQSTSRFNPNTNQVPRKTYSDLLNPIKNKRTSLSVRKSPYKSQHSPYISSSINKSQQNNLQQKFYQFCKNQIIKTKLENSSLQTQLTQLKKQINRIQISNSQWATKIKKKDIEIENLIKQKQKIMQQLTNKEELLNRQRSCLEDSQTIDKFMSDTKKVQNLFKDPVYKQVKQSDNYRLLLKQYEQCKRKLTEYMQTKDDNYRLRNQVAELTLKCTQLFQKSYKFTPTIDHLWQIKNIQFTNLNKVFAELNQL